MVFALHHFAKPTCKASSTHPERSSYSGCSCTLTALEGLHRGRLRCVTLAKTIYICLFCPLYSSANSFTANFVSTPTVRYTHNYYQTPGGLLSTAGCESKWCLLYHGISIMVYVSACRDCGVQLPCLQSTVGAARWRNFHRSSQN